MRDLSTYFIVAIISWEIHISHHHVATFYTHNICQLCFKKDGKIIVQYSESIEFLFQMQRATDYIFRLKAFLKNIWDRRDGSLVKSTDYFFRGPRFESQYPHGRSQPSVRPVAEDLMASVGPRSRHACWHNTYFK